MFLELIDNWHWQRPLWLLLVPVLLLLVFITKSRILRAGDWAEHIDSHLLSHLALHKAELSQRFGSSRIRACAWTGLMIAAIALAGPAWNKTQQPPLKNSTRTIIIVDMTMSMFATDVQPSRLVKLKFKLRELLKSIPDGELALIAYSGDAHIVSPLTDDFRAIDNLIPALSPEIFPSIGSNPATAFIQLQTLLENQPPGQTNLVLYTDEILPASEKRVLTALPKNIDQFIIVGVGTAQGSPIPLPSGRFLKDDKGKIVSTSLDRTKLASFANRVGATYLDLSSDNSDIKNISKLLAVSSSQNPATSAFQNNSAGKFSIDQWDDKGGWFALAVIPFFLCVFRKGYLFILVISVPMTLLYHQPVMAEEIKAFKKLDNAWQSLWLNDNQRAKKALDTDQLDRAADLFESPEWRAIAQSKKQDYDAAIKTYDNLLDSELELSQPTPEVLYNKGFNLAHAGNLPQAAQTFEDAIKIDPNFEEAKKAKAIIDELIEQAEKEQNQQQNSNEQDSKGQDSDDQDEQNPSEQNAEGQQSQSQQSDSKQSESEQSESEQSQSTGKESDQENSDSADSDKNAYESPPSANKEQSEDKQSKDDQEQSENEIEEATAQINEQTEDENSGEENQEKSKQLSSFEKLSANEQAELQSWLNQLTDDPGGLLRRKFDYERQVREREGTVIIENESKQLW